MKSLLITLCILVVLATAVNAGRKPAPQPCTEQTDCPCPLFCTPGRQGQSTCQRKKNADLYVLNVSTYNGIGEIPLRTPTYPYPVSATVSAWGYPTDQVSWGYPVRTIQLYCGTLTTHVFTKDPDVDDANLPFNPTEIVYTLAPGGVFGDAETDNLIFLAPKRGRNSNARIVDWYGLLFNSPDGLSIANLFYQSKDDPGNVPGWVGPYELQYDGYQLQFQLSSFSDTTIQGNGATVSLSFANNDDDDDDDDDQHSDKASYMDSASSSLLASTLMAALLILAILF